VQSSRLTAEWGSAGDRLRFGFRLISDSWFLVKRPGLAGTGILALWHSAGIVINWAKWQMARQAAIILNAKIMPPYLRCDTNGFWFGSRLRFRSTRCILPHRLRRHLIKISFSWYDGRDGQKFWLAVAPCPPAPLPLSIPPALAAFIGGNLVA